MSKGPDFEKSTEGPISTEVTREWVNTFIESLHGDKDKLSKVNDVARYFRQYTHEIQYPILLESIRTLMVSARCDEEKFADQLLGIAGAVFIAGYIEALSKQEETKTPFLN